MTAAAQRRGPLSRRQLWARSAVVAMILVIIVMWIYAFVFADKRAAAKVDDTGWTKRAEQVCSRRSDLLDKNAADAIKVSDGSPQAVGRAVAKATDIIEATLDDVLSVRPEAAQDQKLVREWERLYRIYIADRCAAEAKLANGENAELNETTLNGSPISATIDDFTKPNHMEACATPPGR